jgi:K+/H+ antiporter YhaU regulatory subunit KhtT
MALDNLISVSFTPEQLAALDMALSSIETALVGNVINLTPEERRRYAAVSNEMANWVQKCRSYMSQVPALVPAYINLTELDSDMHARRDISSRLRRATSIHESLDCTAFDHLGHLTMEIG